MVSKTLLALDSNVESYFSETQPDRSQPGLGARTFIDALATSLVCRLLKSSRRGPFNSNASKTTITR